MIVAALHSCSASYAAATPFALSAPPCAPIVRTMTNAAIATPSVAIHPRPARRDMPPSWHPTLGGRDGFLVRVMPNSGWDLPTSSAGPVIPRRARVRRRAQPEFGIKWSQGALEGMTGIVPPPSPLADFVGGRSLGAVGPARKRDRFLRHQHECPPHRLRRHVRALEGMTGIEPALSAWEAEVLPLNYIPGAPCGVRQS